MVTNLKFPSKNNIKLAEFVGILLGDGSISLNRVNGSKQTRLQISLNSEDDRDYIDYVCHLFLALFGETPITKFRKNEKTVDIQVFKRRILEFITKDIGLKVAPKWNRAIIPKHFMQKKYSKYVVRGYFDTDGSLVKANNNGIIYPRLEMKISPAPMQNQFIRILNSLEFNYGVYEIGKGKIRIQLNGKTQLIKWKNEIGFSNAKHERKVKYFFN